MKDIWTKFGLFACFFWLTNCASKKVYLFTPGTGSFRFNHEKPLQHPTQGQAAALAANPPVESPTTKPGDKEPLAENADPVTISPEDKKLAAAFTRAEQGSIVDTHLPKQHIREHGREDFQTKMAPINNPKQDKHPKNAGVLGIVLSALGILFLILLRLMYGPLPPFFPFIILLSLIFSVAGISTSRKGISRIRNAPDLYRGKGLATAGFVLGLIGGVISLLLTLSLLLLLFSGF